MWTMVLVMVSCGWFSCAGGEITVVVKGDLHSSEVCSLMANRIVAAAKKRTFTEYTWECTDTYHPDWWTNDVPDAPDGE